MGYHKDIGTDVVAGICPTTGYPRTSYKHLLDPLDRSDGAPVKDWNKAGTELYNLTNPYGFLEYAVGSGDDFYCFDLRTINCGPIGRFIILDATINSETGGFIEGGGYYVLPVRSEKEKIAAVLCACRMVGDALEWCSADYDQPVSHTIKGWNQRPMFFAHSVASELFTYKFDKVSARELRMGSNRVARIMKEIMTNE